MERSRPGSKGLLCESSVPRRSSDALQWKRPAAAAQALRCLALSRPSLSDCQPGRPTERSSGCPLKREWREREKSKRQGEIDDRREGRRGTQVDRSIGASFASTVDGRRAKGERVGELTAHGAKPLGEARGAFAVAFRLCRHARERQQWRHPEPWRGEGWQPGELLLHAAEREDEDGPQGLQPAGKSQRNSTARIFQQLFHQLRPLTSRCPCSCGLVLSTACPRASPK